MERWDVLDEQGNKIGKTMQRNDVYLEGEYNLAVHIYLCNNDGDYLIQKRSIKKSFLPGIWDITGGAVICGENSVEGAIREVQEEIGITLTSKDLIHIQRLKREHCFADIWLAKVDFDIKDCILQEAEVDEVKFVSSDVLFQTVAEASHRSEDYKDVVLKIINYHKL